VYTHAWVYAISYQVRCINVNRLIILIGWSIDRLKKKIVKRPKGH